MLINSFSKFLNIYFSRVATILYFYSSSHGLTTFHWNTAECGVPLFILTAEPCTAQGQLLLTAAAGAVWFYKTYKAWHYSKVAKMKYLAGTNISVFNILPGFSWSFMYIRQCCHYQQWMTTKDAAGLLMKSWLCSQLNVSPWVQLHWLPAVTFSSCLHRSERILSHISNTYSDFFFPVFWVTST